MRYLIEANILILLFRHIFLFKGALRRIPKLYVAVTFLKYACYALALYIGRAYSGTILYMIYAGAVIISYYRMDKSMFTKIVLTLFIIWVNLMTLKFNIYHLMPYIVCLLSLWVKPYTKNFVRKRVYDVEDILLIVYLYHYKIYVLALYKLMDFVFRHISSSIKKLVIFTEEKTSI